MIAGLVALALLGLGEAAPAAFEVEVSIEGHGNGLVVTVDGQPHALSTVVGPDWKGISLEQPGPVQREYQVDGSDTTSTGDREPAFIASLLATPLYRLDGWLRDESSYSRWEHVEVLDLTSAQPVPGGQTVSGAQTVPGGQTVSGAQTVPGGQTVPGAQTVPGGGLVSIAVAGVPDQATGGTQLAGIRLPHDFLIRAALRRPEAPARLWLLGVSADRREGLELDRDRRNARWLIQRGGGIDALPRWFFPERPGPFAAELLNLLGRTAAASYALLLATLLLARIWHRARRRTASPPEASPPATAAGQAATALLMRVLFAGTTSDVVLAGWLVGAALVSAVLYRQMPHILDAVSYVSQASLFAGGRIALQAGSLGLALHGPFQVFWEGRLFSQYPPGAPALYAVGQVLHVEWLVGPLACLALIAATRWTASALYGRVCGLVVLGLGALSPFVLFQAGSYLSHPIAGGLLAGALATFIAGERSTALAGERGGERAGGLRWYAACGVLLGLGFVTREAASVLFALPLAARLLATRRWRPMLWLVACGLPFVALYLIYNTALTGSPWLLPRTIFNPSDHFGFGDGIGFHTRHTLAAGLANTDELLTLLQFDLFGWPPLFALGLLGLPFLLGRPHAWDLLAAFGVLVFVVAYAAYFYHGIALGPRYYFEAMPWLLLLAGRGAQMLARVAHSRLAAMTVLGLLSLNTLLFYLPADVQRRADFSALPLDRKVSLDFVDIGVFGPRLQTGPTPALVVTDDWWLFNAGLAALNCPTVPDCDVLFVLATTPEDVSRLSAQFPERTVLRTVDRSGRIGLVPVALQ